MPALRELGAPAGEALIYTFEQTLGEDFTPETKACWVALFGTIAAEMERGAEESLRAA